MTLSLVLLFGIALLISTVSTLSVRNLANASGWAVGPRSSRHLHKQPIPRLGGVAIFCATIGAVLVAPVLSGTPPLQAHLLWGVFGPASLIFAVGLIDDFHPLRAILKFGMQIGAALLLYCAGFSVRLISFVPHELAWFLALPITVLWVLWITNAFNLIDGLDGLAAGSAFLSTVVVLVVSLIVGSFPAAMIAAALAGAILGFLRFNFNPATIFLGDCGSLLIGFLLASLALVSSQRASTVSAVAVPVAAFGLPILDVCLAVIRRFLNGRSLFSADKDHIHHKLLRRGFSHRESVLILYGVTGLFGLLSLAMAISARPVLAVVVLLLIVGVVSGLRELHYPEFVEILRVLKRGWNQQRIIAHNLRIRHAAEALLQCSDLEQLCVVLQSALEPIGFAGVGFRFTRHGWPLESILREPLQLLPSGEVRLDWEQGASVVPAWWVSFELPAPEGELWQSIFSVHASRPDKVLLMDLNVFRTSGFIANLAAAAHRLTVCAAPDAEEEERVPLPEEWVHYQGAYHPAMHASSKRARKTRDWRGRANPSGV